MKLKKILSLLLVLVMVLSLAACGEKGNEGGATEKTVKVIKCGYPDPAGDYSHYSYFLKFFNEELEKTTGGTIKFEGYADSQLGSEVDMLNMLSDGTLDSACLSVSVYGSMIPAMQVFSLPYIFQYPEQYEVLADNQEFMAPIKETMKNDWNVVFLGDVIWGGRYNILTKKPVNSIADMKDMVVRITTSKTANALFTALDAIPTVIPFSEVYTAFSTGVCDAVYVPIETYVFKGIYDCATNIANINPDQCLGWPMMSKTLWDSFSAEEQAQITEACAAAVVRQRAFLYESEKHCLDLMEKECGITMTNPDLTPFREAVIPTYSQFVDEIGKDTLKKAFSILDADNKVRGYKLWSEMFPLN